MDRIDFRLDRMEVLVSWCVRHEYFEGQICRCVDLLPDRKTMDLLKKRGVVFKRLGVNCWGLLGKQETEWDRADEVVLKIKVKDPFFAYYTAGEWPEYLQWQPGMLNHIELKGIAKCLKWEYVLLMKEWREDRQLELKEAEGKLEFEQKNSIEINGLKGVCMVSTAEVMLHEKYAYEIRLIEKKSFGSKMVCKRLPWPEPGFFPECREGCIRKVFVF